MTRFLIEALAVFADLVIVMLILMTSIGAFFSLLACIAATLSLSGLTPITLLILLPFFIFNVGVAWMFIMFKMKEYQ